MEVKGHLPEIKVKRDTYWKGNGALIRKGNWHLLEMKWGTFVVLEKVEGALAMPPLSPSSPYGSAASDTIIFFVFLLLSSKLCIIVLYVQSRTLFSFNIFLLGREI